MAAWTTRDIPDQSGKLAIVTGATGGLGLETALGLAGAGAEVVLAGRNPAKGRAADVAIRQPQADAKVRFEAVNLARLESVAGVANRPLATGRPIQHHVNNTPTQSSSARQLTAGAVEHELGTTNIYDFHPTA